MGVLGIFSDYKDCMDIFYLNEDLWIDKNCKIFHSILPLIFKAKEDFKRFYIYFHGKRDDITRFSLVNNEISKSLEEENQIKHNLVFLPNLLTKTNLDKLEWTEEIEETGENLKIGDIQNIKRLDLGDINISVKEDYNECFRVRIEHKKSFRKDQNYAISLGAYLYSPKLPHKGKGIYNIFKNLPSHVDFSVHYLSVTGIDSDDQIAINREGFFFQPIKMEVGSYISSKLFIYTYRNRLLNYKIQKANKWSGSKFNKYHDPLKLNDLGRNPWEGYAWTRKELNLKKTISNWDKKPLKFRLQKYNPNIAGLGLALFFGFIHVLDLIQSLEGA